MQINNSALRITGVCQPASFKRSRWGYKNPESFYRTPRDSRKQRQSEGEGAGEPQCEEVPAVLGSWGADGSQAGGVGGVRAELMGRQWEHWEHSLQPERWVVV